MTAPVSLGEKSREDLYGLLLQWAELQPHLCQVLPGGTVRVMFDGYYEDLPADDFCTCSEPFMRNHVFGAVCSAIDEAARDWDTFRFPPGGREVVTYRFGRPHPNGPYVACIKRRKPYEQKLTSYEATDRNDRPAALLKAWLMLLRDAKG